MKTRLYLDTRRGAEPFPLLLGISRRGQTSWVALGISLYVEQWDAQARQLADLPPRRWPQREAVRNYIDRRRTQIESELLRLEADGSLHGMTAPQIRKSLQAALFPDTPDAVPFLSYFLKVADRHHHPRTREIYRTTYRRILALMQGAEAMTLEDVTPEWLRSFNEAMRNSAPSQNARNVHLRNIRAVMNAALDDGLTTAYPFRRFRLRSEETEKRSLTADQLAEFFALPTTERQEYFRDLWRLMLYLLGINITDLYGLSRQSIRQGRLEYVRAKTGKRYSIKLEPEALDIIARHRGKAALLDLADRYGCAHDAAKAMNNALHSIASEGVLHDVTTYWARHTVATLMVNDLDLPIETVSAALGHTYGSRVTAVYVNFDRRKVDQANRRLLDHIKEREERLTSSRRTSLHPEG